MLPFTVELRTGASVYEQLVYAVQRAIVSNQLSPGDRFPSIRTLSQELRINPNTAQKVVTRLVDQRLLLSSPESEHSLRGSRSHHRGERSSLLVHEAEQLVVEARRLSLTLEQVVEAVQHHWIRLSEVQAAQRQEHEDVRKAVGT